MAIARSARLTSWGLGVRLLLKLTTGSRLYARTNELFKVVSVAWRKPWLFPLSMQITTHQYMNGAKRRKFWTGVGKAALILFWTYIAVLTTIYIVAFHLAPQM